MNTLLYYLIQVIIASGILYLYYHIALRNKKFHQYNRFYLLGAVVISILVPFLNIPVYFTPRETQSSFVLETLTVISSPATEPVMIERTPAIESSEPVSVFNPYDLIYYAYTLMVVLALIRVTYSLARISRLKRNNTAEKIDTIFFINTNEPGTPFSFFRWLFWNRNIELRSEKGEQIFRHELFHIRQKHSIDLLFMELLTVVFWINPFFHLMKKELRAIHEFLADQFAVIRSNKWDYAELLLMQALQTKHPLVNPFFHNQVKRRIAMITNPEKTSYRYLRKLLVLPVAVLIVTVFAFKYKTANEENVVSAKETITIVVDAGHGGTDPGATSPDGRFTEAQLSLAIAKKIQKLAPDYNINVIMTRENDVLPGGATNMSDGNRKRVEISKKADPAAFIAIHVNNTGKKEFQEKNSGIEAYISGLSEYKATKSLGSVILQELSSLYRTTMELKTRENDGIFVLDHSSCPAVILECGYINNATDLAFITDEANQEKIARGILSAVVKHNENFPVGDVAYVTIDSDGFQLAEDSTLLPGRAALVFGKEKVFIYCDTIISHETITNPFKSWKECLIMVDGKQVKPGYLIEQTVRAKEVNIYPPNHSEAIKLYGKDATPGLITLKEVSMVSNLPPSIYYKKAFDGIDQDRHKRATQDTDIVFEKVEIEAAFPGGEKAWRAFLEKNLDANVPVKNGVKPGTYTVFVQFIVDKNGKASEYKVLTNHGYGLEEESLKCIRKAGKWSPAIQNGKLVKSIKKMPFIYRILASDKSTSSQ
jgi:N-acetylmuramoyl-L-alanine amidase